MNSYFRPATPDDIQLLLEMMEAFYSIDRYPFDSRLTGINLEEFIADESLGRIWMVEVDERNIGYFALTFGYSFEFKGRIALLDEIFLQKEYRNKGIGKKALEFIFKQAPGLQLKTILMEVEKHNAHAIHLYEKLGFRDHNRLILSKGVER
ncbi:MAG: GNAT family N-acetyltransferase [Bacteroidales bacterium]